MVSTDHDKKLVTVYEMNKFLMLAEAPLACGVCGHERMQIPAQNDERGVVFEHHIPVANLPDETPMIYLTTVCGNCGHSRWYWKEQVVRLLESRPWSSLKDE